MPQSSVRAALRDCLNGLVGASPALVQRRLKPFGGIHGADEHGATPLLLALNEAMFTTPDGLDVIQRLLDAGADVTAHLHGATPLWWAMFAGRRSAGDDHPPKAPLAAIVEVVHRLLDAGAEVTPSQRHHPSHPAMPPLHEAVRLDPSLVRLMLGHGARPHERNTQQHDALAVAVGQCRADSLQALLDDGALMERSHPNGHPLVHLAVRLHAPDVLDVLLAEGADPNMVGPQGRTPLHVACARTEGSEWSQDDEREARATLDRLLDHPSLWLNPVTGDGNTPLHSLARSSYERLEWGVALIERGADPDQANDRGDTPFDWFHATLKDQALRGVPASTIETQERRWHNAIVVAHARTLPALPSPPRRRL